jgi:hypothetical protein
LLLQGMSVETGGCCSGPEFNSLQTGTLAFATSKVTNLSVRTMGYTPQVPPKLGTTLL